MSLDTFAIIAEQYDTEADALADYDVVRALYEQQGLIDTYDAAVLTKRPNGRVEIIKRTEMPTRTGARRGLAAGLAIGAIAALFPAVAMGVAAGALTGAGAGAGLGAIAGHVAGGLRRGDLKDLGELMDAGSSGLVIVAATDMEAKVEAVIKRAKRAVKAKLSADTEKVRETIDAL
jgi:uncharacterized membrane protein